MPYAHVECLRLQTIPNAHVYSDSGASQYRTHTFNHDQQRGRQFSTTLSVPRGKKTPVYKDVLALLLSRKTFRHAKRAAVLCERQRLKLQRSQQLFKCPKRPEQPRNDARNNAQNNPPITISVPRTARLVVDIGKRTTISPSSSQPYSLRSRKRELRENVSKTASETKRDIGRSIVAGYRDKACATTNSYTKAYTEAPANYAISRSHQDSVHSRPE